MTLPVPANAEFSIVAINDPYQCPETTATQPALYRRPLPSTNLKFLNGIMWDGREPDLKTQALDATLVHTEPNGPPTDAQLQQIVNFESSLFTAQSVDSLAGDLTAQGANGGPAFLSTQPFSIGMNSGSGFDPNAFTLYTSWTNASWQQRRIPAVQWRGERCCSIVFLCGFPASRDSTTFWARPQVIGTCTTCHNTPNVGGSSSLPDDGHWNRLRRSPTSLYT